ncbi:hypothetical protein F5Y13DRAFT_196952 [Hypoxylon sp. FL1857]|nr:hypothetical protein F5Y13DRAFT_196952 [Hypoxylon sp. FL1857]
MKTVIYLLIGAVAAGLMAAVDHGANTSTASLPEGYTEVPFSMKGAIEPGGEPMEFIGTLPSILKQIQGIKPNFTWDDFQPSHTICHIPNTKPDLRLRFLWGHDFLKKINQPCEVAAGPRKCALLWCDIGASVWMCNDNSDPISRDCSYIATYVLDLIGNLDCVSDLKTSDGFNEGKALLQGQEFDSDNFNVIAGGGAC